MPSANPMALRVPCDACPFRTDGSLITTLPVPRKAEIAASIEDDKIFTCHKTLRRPEPDPDDEEVEDEDAHPQPQELVCAGATLMSMKDGLNTLPLRSGQALGLWSPEQMHPDAVPLPDSLDHWVHYRG